MPRQSCRCSCRGLPSGGGEKGSSTAKAVYPKRRRVPVKTKICILILVCFLTMAGQCQDVKTAPCGITQISVPLAHQTQGAAMTCIYGPTPVQARDCTLTLTTVSGTGTTPSAVSVDRGGSSPAPVPAALPSITSGWSANGHGLDCGVVGCAGGDYTITLTIPDTATCPSSVTLRLDLQ